MHVMRLTNTTKCNVCISLKRCIWCVDKERDTFIDMYMKNVKDEGCNQSLFCALTKVWHLREKAKYMRSQGYDSLLNIFHNS